MSPSLSLSGTVAVFPCPTGQETINTSMQQCPFCGTDIDHAIAAASATETSKISRAYSAASYLKIMLGFLIPFGALVFSLFSVLRELWVSFSSNTRFQSWQAVGGSSTVA
jgi:hypothetical protein